MRKLKPDTLCVHAGTFTDDKAYGINTPIFASTAFLYPNPKDEVRYPRYFNVPTQKAVADKIAALEGGEMALVFSSGMAAITTGIMTFAKQGDHIIFQSGLYGGTQNFIRNELPKYGIEFDFISSPAPEEYQKAIKQNSKMIYFESPTNPLLSIIDIEAISKIAREAGLLSMIDNTFASPINQQPLLLGVDIVMHSGTKYLNGHSDINCGALIASNEIMEKILKTSMRYGGNLDINACYQLERGLKTLAVRIARHNENALTIANELEKHSKIRKVFYPGLFAHPRHDIAKKQMYGYGGMMSFEIDGDKNDALKFLKNLEIIKPAVSLGGVESLVCLPCDTSHAKLSVDERKEQGISDSLVRFSVGIEDKDDLISDLLQALNK